MVYTLNSYRCAYQRAIVNSFLLGAQTLLFTSHLGVITRDTRAHDPQKMRTAVSCFAVLLLCKHQGSKMTLPVSSLKVCKPQREFARIVCISRWIIIKTQEPPPINSGFPTTKRKSTTYLYRQVNNKYL